MWGASDSGRDLLPLAEVCYRIPIERVNGVRGQGRCRFSRDQTLVIEVQGRRDLHIHFSDTKKCDEVIEKVNYFMELARGRRRESLTSPISESPLATSPTALTPQRAISPVDSTVLPLVVRHQR